MVFLQHDGVPSLDIIFDGPYGVYHSVYDDYNWMKRFGDPGFTYSDVERALQSWLHQNGVLGRYERRLASEQEAAAWAELARLQAKYAG